MDQDRCEHNNDGPDCSGLGCGTGGGGVGGKSSDAFIDRSRVRILLCDNNLRSSEEAFTLLCKCSYQVTSVKSARQVIDALNAEGPDIDIILSEVDLPMAKGMKMLKYIMRDKDLRRIPVIMMSAQDEVSVVVKCLRLGAADYLVKPLRTNELLNLWTHMWRRRRMLGLAEKNIMNYEFDLVASDPSDANTNSTTLFSDDTDDKSRKSTNPELCITSHQEDEVNASGASPTAPAVSALLNPPPMHLLDYRPDVPGISDRRTGQFASCPKKSELRIGESSAFFRYVKSSLPKNCIQRNAHDDECWIPGSSTKNRVSPGVGLVANDTQDCGNFEAKENQYLGDEIPSSSSILDSLSVEPSPPPPATLEFPQQMNSKTEIFSQVHMNLCEEPHPGVSNCHSQASYPYYVQGLMNQVMMPQYPHLPQCPPRVHNMASFPYYPVGLCLQPSQIPPTHPWPLFGGSSSTADVKISKANRREAALTKFRRKRKERCFDKKIRYVNRKKLAERRPRVRGQFVRKANGVGVDLNGHPGSFDLEEEEDEEDEEEHTGLDSSPEEDS